MEIKIEDYLSPEDIRDIVKDELRHQIREHFKNEANAKRLITNISYEYVFQEIDKIIPESKEFIVGKVNEIVKSINYSYLAFNKDYSGKSLGYTYVEDAVRSNKELINEKIKDTIINRDYSHEIWNKFEELGETFIDNIYSIVQIGREKHASNTQQ